MVHKFFSSFLILLGVIAAVFTMFQGLGDPERMVVGQTGDQATLQNIRKDLNLDKPKWKQFVLYLNDVSPLSIYHKETIQRKGIRGLFIGNNIQVGIKYPYLGKSYQSKRKVTDILADALPATIILAFTAMVFATLTGIFLGCIAAMKKGTWIDQTAIVSSVGGISAPSFFMAIIIAYLFGIVWHNFTGLTPTGSLFALDDYTGVKQLQLQNLILPAITLGIRPLAIITQLTRSSMLDVLNQDFIRTARAKGLPQSVVVFRHALPNALNPVITAITGWFAELLAGSFFIEYIFNWNGVGKVTVDALEKLDYPVVMGAVLLSACIFIVVNLFTDVLYRVIDPRIR